MKNGTTAFHIGRQIRRRRAHLDISQEALGEQLGGLTQQAVSKMERGGEVSGSQLYELSRILRVPVDYFFWGLDDEEGGLPTRPPFQSTASQYAPAPSPAQ